MTKLITSKTRIEDLGKPRIIIIGGGFGGLELIKDLRGINAQIVLFDRQNHHTFQPLLYQVATSALQTNSIVFPYRKKFHGYKDFFFRLAEVTRIVPEENKVETSIGSVKYDYLVLATGSTTNYYGNESFEKNTIPLKTIEDAIALRNRIIKNFENALLAEDSETMNSFMDYVIVGGGPTGVEICGALAELKKHVFPHDYKELDMKEMDIHLVEASPRLLNGMSQKSSLKAKEYLEKMGVKVHLNCMVTSYNGYQAEFDKLKSIPTRTMVWAAGVKGNPVSGLSKEVFQPGGRIQVDPYNKIATYDNIYAIGDVALMNEPDFPKGHPMMAPPAMKQGQHLADNFKRLFDRKPLKPFHYIHKGSMATIGRNSAVVELFKFKSQGFIAWIIWLFVHLMSLVGFRNKIAVFFTWFVGYFTYDKSTRVIIGNSFGNAYKEEISREKEILQA